MTIVMGLDQHRAQITAEWIDIETGEISRTRVAPADRAAVRRFLERFGGQRLEVALEATTGWRFVVEELRAVGAGVHLAEPAQTSALRGPKKHAKSDRADARHLRELLLTGRLPESWIPPDHILDLRARVRLRHSLVDERGEWQQRILAELGDCRRFTSSRYAVRYGGLDITVHASDRRRAPGHLSRQGPPVLRWALYEAAQAATRPAPPTTPTTAKPRSDSGTTAPASRSRAISSNAATTPSKNSATRRSRPHELPRARHAPRQPMHRGQLPATCCRHVRVDGLQRPSGRTATSPSGNPITIMSPTR